MLLTKVADSLSLPPPRILLKERKRHRTSEWKDEIQKIQNTGLPKILGAFRFAPIKAMQRDAEILPVNIRMKEIRDRFAIRAIRAVSPRNPVWKLANSNKPAEGDLR